MSIEVFGFAADPAASVLSLWDVGILLAIILVWPIYSYINIKKYPVEKIRHDPNLRLDSYNKSLLHLWALAGAILLVWFWAERPLEALGFRHSVNWPTLGAWAFAALGIFFSAFQLYQVRTNAEARKKIGAQLREVGEMTSLLMPRTNKEHRRAMLLGITAGITEEIIFRGYMIWALALFMPLWAAGLMSICIFGGLHMYQERAGLIQVMLFAVVATLMYLASDSLWPVIVLHVGVDILSISLGRRVSRETGFII